MIRSISCLVALAALAFVAIGCGGGCTNCVNVSACTLPSGMQYSLVYPAPNATSVSTNLTEVVVAAAGTLPANWTSNSGWDVELNYGPTGAYPGQAFGNEFAPIAAGSIPTPNATPSFSNPLYYQSSFSYAANANTPLPPGTTITATLNNLNSSCYPGVKIGTFST